MRNYHKDVDNPYRWR